MAARLAFGRFVLDTRERRLKAGEQTVELNTRYFDALALLARCHDQLVSKERLLSEVWRGVPVTDEALTQCIKTLRRQLGDDAGNPRFIETVPKHGYRFIAPVEELDGDTIVERGGAIGAADRWRQFAVTALAGTIGAGAAGLVGGLLYGFAGASQPLQPGTGSISVMLVLLCITLLVALIGGAGVSLGIATAGYARARSWQWNMIGGGAGGLFIGAFGKLLGIDAFGLLIGQSPGNITGGSEGLTLGAAVGLGAWLATRSETLPRGVTSAALCGGIAGLAISLLGGRLMLGSLDLLTRQLAGSRLRLDQISRIFGESAFGPVTQGATGMAEGALFAACVVGAIQIASRSLREAGTA